MNALRGAGYYPFISISLVARLWEIGGMNRLLIALGASLVLLGLGWSWIRRVPLFRLPGDIVIDRPGFRFFFPLTTMLLLSVLISVIAWLARR